MKKIIILTSGKSEATEKIVSFFNGGDRVHTDLVFTDNIDEDHKKRLETLGCSVVYLNPDIWEKRENEIIELVEQKSPEIIILDGWNDAVPEELAKITDYHVVNVTSPEDAPKEVIAALESLDPALKMPASSESDNEKSMDEEWAESLQINFDPEKIQQTPPPIPSTEEENKNDTSIPPEIPEQTDYSNISNDNFYRERENHRVNYDNNGYRYENGYNEKRHEPYRDQRNEPMPPTYLIWSVLCTIFCCFIPGIIAIIYSSQVSTKFYSGDIEGAKRSSRIAEIWIIVSFVLGILTATLYLPIMMIS